jgi:aminoglycoside 6'-N-acetyltransferase
MGDEFHRDCFENAIPIRGEQTTLRPVEAADIDLLVEWHADPEVSRYWDAETFTHEELVARLARPDVMPYLVLSGGIAIGYLQVWWDAEGSGLDMFLEPTARGQGLGPDAARAMARHLIEDRGWTRVTVDPYAWNEQALRAWRNAGFVEVSRHEPDDDHTAEWILLEFSPR